jgi:hypothetical protein
MPCLFPLLLSLLFTLATSCKSPPKILTIHPTSVNVAFDDTINHEDHNFHVQVVLPRVDEEENELCRKVVIYIGNIEPGERSLPAGAGAACESSAGRIVIDHSYAEEYAFSCCAPLNISCVKTCEFRCPLPPPALVTSVDNIYEEIVGFESKLWSSSWNSSWVSNSTQSFTYHRERKELGIIKTLVTVLLFLPLVLGAISVVTGKLHAMAASTPFLSFFVHLTTTVTIFAIVSYLLFLSVSSTAAADELPNETNETNETNNNQRLLMRLGLIYALITISYSPLLLYTPKPRVQTVHIHHKTLAKYIGAGTCERWTKLLKNKRVRDVCALVMLAGMILQLLSIFAVYNGLLEFLGADIQTSCTVVIAYAVLVLVHFVAFVTAIYELRPILRLDRRRGKLTKAYHHTVKSLLHSSSDKRKVAFYTKNQNQNDWSNVYLFDGRSDFIDVTHRKVDSVFSNSGSGSDACFDVCDGCICIVKLHRTERKKSDAYMWRVGQVNNKGDIVLDMVEHDDHLNSNLNDQENGRASHPLLKISRMPTEDHVGRCCGGCCCCCCVGTGIDGSGIGSGSISSLTKKLGFCTGMTNLDESVVGPSLPVRAGHCLRQKRPGTLSYLQTQTDFQQFCQYGTLYHVSKYDDYTFRFLEVGILDDGIISEHNNIMLALCGYLLNFQDGDATDPDIEWKPNLVESMRSQGWVQFDRCGRCCRGSKCGKWHMLLMSSLCLCWLSVVLYVLFEITKMNNIGRLSLLICMVEILLVVSLSIAGYIVSTDVDEDDNVSGIERLKLLHDTDGIMNTGTWVEQEHPMSKGNSKDDTIRRPAVPSPSSLSSSSSSSLQKTSCSAKLPEISPEISPDPEISESPESSSSALHARRRFSPSSNDGSSPDSNASNDTNTSLYASPLSTDFNTRGRAIQSVVVKVERGMYPKTIYGDNGVTSKTAVHSLENEMGYNILLQDFLLSMRKDYNGMSLENTVCVRLEFEFISLNGSETNIRPSNIALGLIQTNHLDNLIQSTIGNTSTFAHSFGVHGDDGSILVSRKDRNDQWKNTTGCISRPHAIWWNQNGGRQRKCWQMCIGLMKGTLYVILPNGKTMYLPEIPSLLPEWLNDESVKFLPVISFEYADSTNIEHRHIKVTASIEHQIDASNDTASSKQLHF